MILTIEQIAEILKENPNKKMMDLAKADNKRLSMHLFGAGMKEYLELINNFENPDQHAVREKYARSNKDIMERITRPVDKVFSAKGGSTFYDLPDNIDREFRERLANTENGLSLRKWIEQYWKPAYLSDPMGLVYMEIDESGDVYPTYKSIGDIYTYQPNGRKIDYLVFHVKEKESNEHKEFEDVKKFRVVDDAWDMVVKWDGRSVEVVGRETFPNHFGFVPGFINSDIPVLATDYFASPLAPIIEIADEYLRECSVKTVYKLLHGFPKYWEYASECPNCNGTGNVAGETCKVCNGTRVKLKWDVSDRKTLPLPDTKDEVVIAPNVGGYITPPLETWVRMSEELYELESVMFETLWGTKQAEQAENNTATGKFIDTQPVNDRLSKFSDAAEVVEKFITDCMGKLYYGSMYGGSAINYGRRFTIESPDTIWEKYENARSKGAPDAVLDDLMREYIQSKYENNSMELQRQLKAIDLEPFPHLTASQVQSLKVAPKDYTKKVYYSDFIKTLSDNEVIFVNIKALQGRFDEFAEEKMSLMEFEQVISSI